MAAESQKAFLKEAGRLRAAQNKAVALKKKRLREERDNLASINSFVDTLVSSAKPPAVKRSWKRHQALKKESARRKLIVAGKGCGSVQAQ